MRRAPYALVAALIVVPVLLGSEPVLDRLAPESIERELARRSDPAPTQRRVVLISIDGLAPYVLADTRAPTLERLAREGARAGLAETVVPSITLTSHTSMLSALPPEQHGVEWNRYLPWRSVATPTLFTECARLGLRCGLFAGKRKFAHFAEHEPGVERYAFGPSAARVLELAADYLRQRDPDFVMIHLAEVDAAGHAEGWGSAVQREAIAHLDGLLAAFLEQAWRASPRPLAVIVTADHGGHGTRHGTEWPVDVRIPWLAWGDGVFPGTLPPRVSTMDTAPTVLALLGRDAPAGWQGRALFPVAR